MAINNIKTKDLVVCILFYEKLEQTIACIKSFLPSKVNIYVLNNGSSNRARETLGKFCKSYKQIKIFDSDTNLGVGVGRNYLVNHTIEEWLLFVDNDIRIKTGDWLKRFNKQLSLHRDVEVFIPRLYNKWSRCYASNKSIKIEGNKAILNTEIPDGISNCFPGGASFVNRKLFDRLGLYDNKMFIGLEDYELSIRGILLGKPVKARIIKDIELIHDHRLVKKEEDRDAVFIRYDVDYIRHSFNRIIKKHNIFLEGDWTFWCLRAQEKMLKRRKESLKSRLKRWIPDEIKKLVKRILLKIKRVPTECTLFMTDRCNLKCLGCRRSILSVDEAQEMKVNTVKKLLSLYPPIKSFSIAGFGEPTLCDEFVDIVNFLGKNGKKVKIITNGLNLAKLQKLTYKPDRISISLNGYDNESYLNYTRVDAYNEMIENFLKLKNRFNNVGFSYIITRKNYRDLDKLLPLCDRLKPDFLHLINYLAYDPADVCEVQKIITVKDKEIMDYTDELCKNRDYIKIKPVSVDFENPKFSCRSYDTRINLDGDGNIGGCLRQIPPDPSFGNIFMDIDPFNSLEMSELRRLQHTMARTKKTPHKECHYCFGNWYPN